MFQQSSICFPAPSSVPLSLSHSLVMTSEIETVLTVLENTDYGIID